jgi:hypothetical protein
MVEILDDLVVREVQLLLVSLQQSWNDERNRNFDLMKELDAAEQRLLALFSDEGEARGRPKADDQFCVQRISEAIDAAVQAKGGPPCESW